MPDDITKIREDIRYKLEQATYLSALYYRILQRIRWKVARGQITSRNVSEWIRFLDRLSKTITQRVVLPDRTVFEYPYLFESLESFIKNLNKIKRKIGKKPEVYGVLFSYELRDLESRLREILSYRREAESILFRIKPPRYIVIKVDRFYFTLRRDWDYTIEVETPIEWKPRLGVMIGDYNYAVKLRAITLCYTFGIAKSYSFGYTWKPMSPEEIESYEKSGNPLPQRLRRMIHDPRNLIVVREVRRVGGRRFWIVDFSNFSSILPKEIDIANIENLARSLGYSVERVVFR